jgi:hypothetical protein
MQRTLGSKCKGKKITMTWKEIERGGQCAFQKTHHQKHNAHYGKIPRSLPTSKVLGIQCTLKTTNSSTKTLRPKCGYHVQKNQVKDLELIPIHMDTFFLPKYTWQKQSKNNFLHTLIVLE